MLDSRLAEVWTAGWSYVGCWVGTCLDVRLVQCRMFGWCFSRSLLDVRLVFVWMLGSYNVGCSVGAPWMFGWCYFGC